MGRLTQIRYYLEIISAPIFAFLVTDLSADALAILFDFPAIANWIGGFGLLVIFIGIWHHPMIKKFVPCSHDHCHHENAWPHLTATLAFLFHIFPESGLRSELIKNFNTQSVQDMLGAVGFSTHFLVDVIVVILLTSFWQKTWQKISFLGFIISIWLISFYAGEQDWLIFADKTEGSILILSAFLLTMFVHMPHRPQKKCSSC